MAGPLHARSLAHCGHSDPIRALPYFLGSLWRSWKCFPFLERDLDRLVLYAPPRSLATCAFTGVCAFGGRTAPALSCDTELFQFCRARPLVSGKASIASAVMTLAPATYHAGETGLCVAPMSQVMMNCVVPPNSATPTA